MSNSEESSLGKVLKEISGLIGNFPELSLELNNIKNAPNTSMMQGMYDALKRNNPNLPSLLFDTENLVPSSTEKETKMAIKSALDAKECWMNIKNYLSS